MKPSDRIAYRAGEKRLPLYGNFELSPLCNFACRMCYVRRDAKQVRDLGGLQAMEQWLDWARQARDAGMLFLMLTGGEPFLYPNFLRLYEELSALGLIISINTNGALIDEDAVAVLKRCVPKRLNITLYGASAVTYGKLCGDPTGFDRVMKNISRLRENGIAFRFNCSLTKENCRDLPQIVAIAESHGVPIEIASYMFPPRRRGIEARPLESCLTAEEAGCYAALSMRLRLPEDAFQRYANSMERVQPPPEPPDSAGREMACRAGRCSFWVNWQGLLSACGMLESPGYSLVDRTPAEAWQQIVSDTNELRCLDGCGGCPNYSICHPCAAAAWCETGTMHGRPEYKCQMLLAEAAASKLLKNEPDKAHAAALIEAFLNQKNAEKERS